MSRWRDKQKEAKAKRDLALSRPELRNFDSFTLIGTKMPDEGLPCKARGSAWNSEYLLPMLVCRRALKWVNYKTGTPIEADIIAWRYATEMEKL